MNGVGAAHFRQVPNQVRHVDKGKSFASPWPPPRPWPWEHSAPGTINSPAVPVHLILELPMRRQVNVFFLRISIQQSQALPGHLPWPPKADIIRFDAKAEGNDVAIGEWRSEATSTPEAAWFAIKITRKAAPWVWARGEPFRAIASLELLAAVVSCLALIKPGEFKEKAGLIDIPMLTDNMGNSDIARKNLTTKIAEARGLVISLDWVLRLQDEEADALTNSDFRLFTASNRVHIDLEAVEFIALHKLLEVYEDFEKKLKEQKERKRERSMSEEKLAPKKKAKATAEGKQRPQASTAGKNQLPRKIPEWKQRVPLKEKDPW